MSPFTTTLAYSVLFAGRGREVRIGDRTWGAIITENLSASELDVEHSGRTSVIIERNLSYPREDNNSEK